MFLILCNNSNINHMEFWGEFIDLYYAKSLVQCAVCEITFEIFLLVENYSLTLLQFRNTG